MAAMAVFYDPFRVVVLDVDDREGVHAARHVFGAEPTDVERYQLLLRRGVAPLDRAERCGAVDGVKSGGRGGSQILNGVPVTPPALPG